MCASNFIATVWTLFYSNMTVSLCMRQGSKRNDDSVSVEELDWSAESQKISLRSTFWLSGVFCRGYQQHDAHEFLRYLLDHLHREMQGSNNGSPSPTLSPDRAKHASESKCCMYDHIYSSFVIHLSLNKQVILSKTYATRWASNFSNTNQAPQYFNMKKKHNLSSVNYTDGSGQMSNSR